ncbi:FAD-binding protein [Flavobacteriaceae bacterium Ap0902]|nr:FAD-binding protein [Flavobacteriaceae bacterium Ap0902]
MIWKNWSETVKFEPKNYIEAKTIEEVKEAVLMAKEEGRKLRVAGSGHSFSRVCETKDILLSIDAMTGIVEVHKEQKQITFWAGTTVRRAGELCLEHGLAQENLGDFDLQTLAGATSTGTHGTGINLNGISHQIVAFWVVTADGELLECSKDKNPKIFEAGRVALGLFGVIVKVRLQLVDAYKLKVEKSLVNFFEILPQIPTMLQNHRNLEFFWFPMTKKAMMKKMSVTDEPVDDPQWKNFINQHIIENYALNAVCNLSYRWNLNAKKVNQLMTKFVGNDIRINDYNKILATERMVRFKEMELNVPAEHFEAFFTEVSNMINEKQYPVVFPVEIRWVKADDIWLSPTYQRDAVYLAFHTYWKNHVPAYFYDMQEIAKKYEVRPHWGKMHNLEAAHFEKVYPKWHDFMEIRERLDPDQIFVGPYMSRLIKDHHQPMADRYYNL